MRPYSSQPPVALLAVLLIAVIVVLIADILAVSAAVGATPNHATENERGAAGQSEALRLVQAGDDPGHLLL